MWRRRPTDPGYYWFRENADNAPIVVRVWSLGPLNLMVDDIKDIQSYALDGQTGYPRWDHDGEWWGPIEAPPQA